MAAIPVWMVIASSVMGAVGAAQQASAQAAAQNYNAAVAKQNAAIAEEQGALAAGAQDREAQKRIGMAMAAYGASGVSMDSGSPADVLADSARSAALDNLTIRYNAHLKALGFQSQAALDELGAGYSARAGNVNATAAILQGGTKAWGYGYTGGTGDVGFNKPPTDGR